MVQSVWDRLGVRLMRITLLASIICGGCASPESAAVPSSTAQIDQYIASNADGTPFLSLSFAGWLADDRIAAFDRTAGQVLVMAVSGKGIDVETRFGTRGQGPGKLAIVSHFQTVGDQVVLFSMLERRLLIFEDDGTVVGDVRIADRSAFGVEMVRYRGRGIALASPYYPWEMTTLALSQVSDSMARWESLTLVDDVLLSPDPSSLDPLEGPSVAFGPGYWTVAVWPRGVFRMHAVDMRDGGLKHLERSSWAQPSRNADEVQQALERRAAALSMNPRSTSPPALDPEDFAELPHVARLLVDDCDRFWAVTNQRRDEDRVLLAWDTVSDDVVEVRVPWELDVQDVRGSRMVAIRAGGLGLAELVILSHEVSCPMRGED